MTLLFISILASSVFCTTAAPQLKLGNSGYEIISIGDQSPEDSIPLASKLTSQSATRYNGIVALNLEKDTDDDEPIISQHRPTRHFQRSSVDQKSIVEPRANAIGATKKRLSSLKIHKPTSKNFPRFSTAEREAQMVIPIFEKTGKDSSFDKDESQEESSREKINPKNESIGKMLRQSIGNSSGKIEGDGKFESDFEANDSTRGDYKIVSVPAFDLLDEKSSQLSVKPREKIVTPSFESGFTLVTHFPSARIHRPKASIIGHKKAAMFSPIYPSGFEISNSDEKSEATAVKEIRGKHFGTDGKKSKKIVRTEDENRFFLGQEFNEILTGGESEKYDEKIGHNPRRPLILDLTTPNGMSHEISEPKTEAKIFPMRDFSLNAQNGDFFNQRSPNKITHFQVVSVPLVNDDSREAREGRGDREDGSSEVPAGSPRNNSCKQAKPPAPAFYEFLAKFSNILLGKSLQYEAQARDDGQDLLDDIYVSADPNFRA